MLTIILLMFVKTVLNQDIVGVQYSFKNDFNEDFHTLLCDNNTSWIPIKYSYINVPSYKNSTEGIKSSRNSCTNSFPIVFLNGTIEIIVFTKTTTKYSGITIIIENENNRHVTKYVFNKNKRNYKDGWSQLILAVEHTGIGHINLLGRSDVNEIVIIDSLEYKPYNGNRSSKYEETDLIFEDKELEYYYDDAGDESEIIDHHFFYDDEDLFDNDGSGDGSGDGGLILEDKETAASGLSFWEIVLLVIGVVTVVALLAVSAYYLGKMVSKKEHDRCNDDITAFDEPPRVLIIPRARRIMEGRRNRGYDNL